MIKDLIITDYEGKDVASAPDRLQGTAQQNKEVFDGAIKAIIEPRINAFVEELTASGAAEQLGFTDENFAAENIKAALLELFERSYNKEEVDEKIDNTADDAAEALAAFVSEIYTLISRDKGAIASIGGVDNAGGDIALEEGTGISFNIDPATKSIKISATGESVPAAHAYEHEAGGKDIIDHAKLGAGLDYESSGHTGFFKQPEGSPTDLMTADGGHISTTDLQESTFQKIMTGRFI